MTRFPCLVYFYKLDMHRRYSLNQSCRRLDWTFLALNKITALFPDKTQHFTLNHHCTPVSRADSAMSQVHWIMRTATITLYMPSAYNTIFQKPTGCAIEKGIDRVPSPEWCSYRKLPGIADTKREARPVTGGCPIGEANSETKQPLGGQRLTLGVRTTIGYGLRCH